MNKTIAALIGIGALLMANSAFAHHSRSMFDQTKQITLAGTVKEFQWTNPHCWIQVLVPDPNNPQAAPIEWGVEMGAPVELMRKGWKPRSLNPGDKVTISSIRCVTASMAASFSRSPARTGKLSAGPRSRCEIVACRRRTQ